MAGRSSPKDLVMLVIDVGPMMDVAPPTGSDTPLEASLKIASQIVTQKLFGGCKDEIGMVLFGTPNTDNDLALSEGGYDNISVVWAIATPTLDLLKFIRGQIQIGDNPADFIDAIVVAMDMIVKASQEIRKVGDKKIYLFTTCGSEYNDDSLDQIISGLQQQDIQLIIIGPDIQTDYDDEGEENDRGGPPDPPRGSSSKLKKTPQQIAGESILTRVVHEIDATSFTFPEALNFANVIQKTAKKQTTRFAGHLEIGSKLKVSCKIFTKTMLERPTTWKKLSAISQSSARPGEMAVRYERSYHMQDEDETEVEAEDAVKGYRYGKSLIPVSTEDEEAIKLSSMKHLSVLGFTSVKNIKHHHIIGSSVQVVIPNPDDETASVSLSSLIHALYEMNMVGIVRYVFRKNANPRLCALIPHIKSDCECLFLYQLPYMEDLRQYPFVSLSENPKYQLSDNQLQAIDDFINDMDLMEGERDDNDDLVEAVKSKNISNPLIQRTFQCMQHRALNPDDPLPPIEPFLSKCLEPSEVIMTRCSSHLQRIKDLFPLTKVEKKEGGSATEVWRKTSDVDLEAEPPVSKKLKAEEETDFSVISLARGEIEEVGTVDPIGDYKKLIDRKDVDNFEEGSKQLQNVTLRLIKESFGDVMYNKSLTCIQTLREEAIRHSEPDMFNEYLKKTRDDLIGTRYAPFWDKIIQEGITLITSDECAESSVSTEEAKQFISSEPEQTSLEEEKKEEETDADDLLAMMD